MPQRHDIVRIDFQANARNANAAIEAMRQKCEECNNRVKDLKEQLKNGINANLPADQLEKMRTDIKGAVKETKQWTNAYKQLIKGMRTLDEGIKAFNDGSLASMSAAFQKSVYNAAKLTRTKLDPLSENYKKDKQELTALMDASQQYYARLQADTQQVIKTIQNGGKVSRQALTEELQQQKELLSVLAETDKGYKQAQRSVAVLDHYLKAMGGSYDYIRQNIKDTKKVSDETLRNMFNELQQTNNEGRVTQKVMRENSRAMREIRAEQSRRVENVLGGDLTKQSEGNIRAAIASAKELIQIYGTSSKQAQTLAAQIVNAESYLKTVGVEGARAAKQQADAAQQAADKYKLMQDRMKDVGRLSQSALTETQKFWQAQMDGATKGSRAYREAERNLKTIAAEQQRVNEQQLQQSAKRLNRKGLGTLSTEELQQSIAAAKQLASTMKTTDPAYKQLVDNIIRAEDYVKKFGIEGQRTAKQAAERLDEMNSRMSKLYRLSDGALEETRKFWLEQMNGAERGSKAYKDFEANMRAVEERQRKIATEQNRLSANKIMGGTASLSTMSEGEIRRAIEGTKEYQKTLQVNTKTYNDLAVATAKAEEYLKKYGAESAAQLKLMTDRLGNLKTLSQSGLVETQKYWQAQLDGAARGSAEFKQAEKALKDVNEQLNVRSTSSAMRVMANPGNYSDAEIRKTITAMEQLRDTTAHGSTEWNRYNRLVEQGKQYLQEWAQTDSIVKFEGQMQNLTKLSDTALQETKKFWEEQVAGSEKGSADLAKYEAQLEKVKQEERERQQIANEMAVQGLKGNLSQMSESEIRRAVEAGRQLIQTYETGSQEAKDLAKDIVAAERHLEQYGIAAERSAQKEADAIKKAADERAKADNLMETQLQQGSALSESALKAQKQYWQRLIDDPKTASTSLQQYKANLTQVEQLQANMVAKNGQQALGFFRNGAGDASADEIRKQAEALKKYRDTLPVQSEADLIREINQYLAQTGQAAGSAASQMMSLNDAINIGLQGHSKTFHGTNEQLKLAKKTLEESLGTVAKGSDEYKRIRSALDGIALEEKRVGTVTKEVDAILSSPKGRSFNELKLAVEEGRKALNNMSRTTKKEKEDFDELAAKVKAADLEMKNLGNSSKGSASAFEKAWSRLKTYITLYMGAAVAIQKVVSSIDDLMTLSDKMGEVRKTTGLTADQVNRLTNQLAKLDVRTPIADLEALASTAGTLGLKSEEDILGFTEAANKMMIALPEMGEDAAMQLMRVAMATGEVDKIRKQLNDGTIQGSSATAVAMEKVASTIDRLRASSAATAPEITDFVKRVGAVGSQSGISVDQVAALGSTVSSLGMGVEMAGTALSRMIPAIKNNAFSIAQILGVTPDSIRELFDAGQGMEVILQIFQKMHDQNMNADSIEKLLGTGGMQEIMKELNQQGARAGIVFAGLSQNVDQLRAALGVAHEAYEENTAIQQEFDRMNDTTAAKWERLKNQIEEVFVNAANSQWLGNIIDGLRNIIDLLTGNGGINVAIRTLLIGVVAAKTDVGNSIGEMINNVKELDINIKGVGKSFKEFYAANKANIWFAIASGVVYLVTQLYSAAQEAAKFNQELAKLDEEEQAAEREVNRLFTSYEESGKKAEEAAAKQASLEAQTKALRKEVSTLSSSTDKSTAATSRLNAKQTELKKKEEALKKATDESNKANTERSKLISQINSKYSKYLNYMLSEATNARQVALAHWQIVDALKAENAERHLKKQKEKIDDETSEDINEATSWARSGLNNLPSDVRERILNRWNTVLGSMGYSVGDNGRKTYEIPALQGLGNRRVTSSNFEGLQGTLKSLLVNIVRTEIGNSNVNLGTHSRLVNVDQRGNAHYADIPNTVQDFVDILFPRFNAEAKEIMKREERYEEVERDYRNQQKGTTASSVSHANEANDEAYRQATATLRSVSGGKALTGTQIQNLAQQVSILAGNFSSFNGELENADKYFGKGNNATLENAVNTIYGKLSAKQRQQILAAAQNTQSEIGTGSGGGGGLSGGGGAYAPTPENVWGSKPDAASTNWSKWTASDLVERRKQMNTFVKALQEDTDVQSVLAEDPALKKAIEKGKSSDMRTVINWYNNQRLKIQDELHARYLTNTGSWKDPKQAKQRKKQISKMIRDEMSYYLDELDAYYTENKSKIEEAQGEGLIDEAEAQRRTLQNEQVWRQRRAELQMLYADKSKDVAKDEQDAIAEIISERTGEDTDFIIKNIQHTINFIKKVGEKDEAGKAVAKALWGDLDLGYEKDFLKMNNAVSKQMQAIADIIAKERPFDGISKDLLQNVETMGVIQGDFEKRRLEMTKKGLKKGDEEWDAMETEQSKAVADRLTFLLQESEDAYSMTWEKLEEDMRKGGFDTWADAILGSQNANDQKEALIAQLHTVYDAVQDAIKKESSLVKKQVEIQWNNAFIPDPNDSRLNLSIKQAYERVSAALGLEEGKVSRANSLIGAGAMSERVADKLAIKQMQVQLAMQEHYYNIMRKIGQERVDNLARQEKELRAQGKINEAERMALDRRHAQMSLNLSTTEEETALAKQREEIVARTEESEARLYTALRDWASLLTSSVQSLFEASNTGLGDYYNNLAKMRLTGEGSAGGTYVIIDNAGTEDATAHYETLDGEQALARQLEIDQQNAVADAWKKVMDDINAKISDTITDWINSEMQNAAVDANTEALGTLTNAINNLNTTLGGQPTDEGEEAPGLDDTDPDSWPRARRKRAGLPVDEEGDTGEGGQEGGATSILQMPAETVEEGVEQWQNAYQSIAEASSAATGQMRANQQEIGQGAKKTDTEMTASSQSSFAKMIQAANLYGMAYQTMSNDNLSTSQKVQMFALQAAGQATMAMLTTDLAEGQAKNTVQMPGILGKLLGEMPYPAAIATFAAITALMGGLMALAVSQVSKSKSEIAQVTGAGVSQGRLSTGMLTYAEGNVNEFTDPSTLTPGRSYNVDSADGHTYRAKFTGSDPGTHITNGPEFHLVGERGREAIIDAHTTRLLQMDDTGIWQSIQTLYNGGGLRSVARRRGRGMRAFAEGNIDEFDDVAATTGGATATDGMGTDVVASLQASLDRNSAVLERAITEGIKGVFDVHGKGGLIDSYDTGKKQTRRYGTRY